MTTLEHLALDRAALGMPGLLFEVYSHAYCAGAGIVCDAPHSETMRALLWLLDDRHRTEVLLPRGYDPDPRIAADDLPGWLLAQRSQADSVEPPAVEGWPV